MRLKTLELQGFKSFPDKTVLSFDHPLTAVVGPNGSGKSNISDAIRWVLGEQSVKQLRGGRMEDVIFGGTRVRKRQGFAQVSLTLDHCAGMLPDGGDEVTVTRRYYRSGESEYALNGQQVRLRDVNALFMDTGLGQEGYALIGQGKIDEILSAKSTQRREIFEEAAGISRCRHQKEETERKLERTQENLLRIGDKIEELELQRGPLKVQAEKATKYLALQEELKVLEVSLWMDKLDGYRAAAAKARADFEAVRHQAQESAGTADALYAKAEALTAQLAEVEAKGEELRGHLAQREEALRAARQRSVLLEERIRQNQQAAARLQGSMEDQRSALAQLDAQLEHRRSQAQSLEQQEQAGRETVSQAQEALRRAQSNRAQRSQERQQALGRQKERLDQCRRLEKQAQEGWLSRRMEAQALADRLSMLTELSRVYEGYTKGVKTAMAEARRGRLHGVLGPVGELFHSDARYTVALETALGGALQNLLVEHEGAGKAVLHDLKRRDGGRVTCLPLTALRPAALREEGIEREPGYLAIAADLVDCPENCRPAARSLLGRTVVVETLEDGVRLAKKRGYRFPVVTLDGEILRPGGSMTGGSVNRRGGVLSRGAQEESLRQELEQAQTALGQSEAALETARAATQRAAAELEALENAPETQEPQEGAEDAERFSALRAELASVQAERRSFALLLEQLTAQRTAAAAALHRDEGALEVYGQENRGHREELTQLEAQIETLEEERQGVSQALGHHAAGKLELERSRSQTEREARQANETQLRLQRETAALEQKKLQAEMEEKRLLDRLWDGYGLSHQAAQAIRVPLEGGANTQIGRLKEAIRALGRVNLGAVEEFQRVEERYNYLFGQKTDVETAQQDLEGIIAGITDEMEEIFRREFAKIQAAFSASFVRLFGGGQGNLALEDAGDVLNCGIDIQVQPPGKSLRTISLLSGGERALVAIALYLAILEVHPTPFCVVDEIEAALDEANGQRFIHCLQAMAGETQFILITHRRSTMEGADVLYGVTMEHQGVSQVLMLDLEQAEALLGKKPK